MYYYYYNYSHYLLKFTSLVEFFLLLPKCMKKAFLPFSEQIKFISNEGKNLEKK